MNIENPVANAVAGGWQVGSILTVQTGFPLTIYQGGDPSNTGHTFDRPNATGVDPFDGWNSTTAMWWNPAAFSRTADGQPRQHGPQRPHYAGRFELGFLASQGFQLQ